MKTALVSLAIAAAMLRAAGAEVYINAVLPNAPGGDTGNEHFELRGAPGLSLANYYLLSIEGQGTGTPGKGDVNQFFDLGAFSLGANGYLFARQYGSPYTATDPEAAVIENSIGSGWGQANAAGSSVGHYSDSAQVDLENGTTTFLLVRVASAAPPSLTNDLDLDNDGLLDLPEGWTVVDSVGIMDGANVAATDASYGAITFRAPDTNGVYLGTCAYGNIIDVPGPLTTSSGTFYVGRKGVSTGSTAADWMGSILQGAAAQPLNFYFYSASDPAYTGMRVSDMVCGGPNASIAPLGALPYMPAIHGARFTNYTQVAIGGTVGAVAVDPRDDTTILFTIDTLLGGIYRASKVASGNWGVDPAPVVGGLDRPSGLVVQTNGTLWWLHDVTKALMRLEAPWESHAPETVVSNFGGAATDDDPVDLTFAPANFSGSIGQPHWIVIADRGSDGDAFNALNMVDPGTTNLDEASSNFLVSPTTGSLGWDNLNDIDALPRSGEVVALSQDGFISAVDANGWIRSIIPTAFWPLGSTPSAPALAVDPLTGRIWLADDSLDEIWSVDPSATGQTPDAKELSFPLADPAAAYRQIDFHDPGMAFAASGAFLVVSDSSTAGGGGRLMIFHNEPFTIPEFAVSGAPPTTEGVALSWESAGSVRYAVERSIHVADPASFISLATNLTARSFIDTNPPPAGAFYRVVARP